MMLTAAVRDLKLSFPNFEIDVRTSCSEIWENNPYLTPLDEKAQEERRKRRLSSLSSEEIAWKWILFCYNIDVNKYNWNVVITNKGEHYG